MGMITITPEPQAVKWVAQMLLELADHPREVEMVSRPNRGFRVSEELYEQFQASVGADANLTKPVETVAKATVEKSTTAKRKPGRPRKNQEGQ